MQTWVILLVVGLATLAGGVAQAGCPNACSATAEAVTVTPPLDCATLTAVPQTCDCSLLVSVTNGCAGALEATGFTWDSCQTAAGTGAPSCAAVQPGGRGARFLKVSTPGRSAWSLGVLADDGSHTVDVALQVSSFDRGGCAVAGAPPPPASSLATTLLVGAGVLLVARRRARRRAREVNRVT